MSKSWARPAIRSTVNLFRSGFTFLFLALLWPAVLQAQLATGTVDFDVDSLRDQTQVTISLSDDSTLVLLRDYVVDDGPGKYTWIGFVQDDVNGRAFITVNAPNVVGNIQTSTKLFELAITEAATEPVQEIDPLTLPPEAEPIQPPIFSHGFEDDAQQSQAETVTADCDDTPAGIDVMVLYSDDAAGAPGDIEAEIRNAIRMANDSFLYSNIKNGVPDGIELKLNLVHTQMLQVDESAVVSSLQLLDDFKGGIGEFSAVPGLRNQFAADLSVLILKSGDNCGRAFLSYWKGVAREFDAFGFVRQDCIIDHTFTHELGHLFGAHHDKYAILSQNSPLPNPFGANYGYSYIGPVTAWRTIMAYQNECKAAGFTYCPRPGFFSSPDNLHAATPTGIAGTDNRKQLIEAAPALACYRSRPKLTVQKVNHAGGGAVTQGVVKSTSGIISPSIDCGPVCLGTAVGGTKVLLNAQSSDGWTFMRWSESGVCPGSTNPQCEVSLIGDKTAIAEFAGPVTLTVQKINQAGGGTTSQGLVQSTSGAITPGINCGQLCQGSAVAGTEVQLTASDTPPWIFVRWDESGACAGSNSRTCAVTLNSNQTARAVFEETVPIPLTTYSSSHSCYLEIYSQQYHCDGVGESDSSFVTYQGELTADYGGGGIANIRAGGQVNIQPGQSSIRTVLEGEATGQWFSRGQQSASGSFSTTVFVTSDTLPSGTPVTVRVSFYLGSQRSLSVELSEPPIVQWLVAPMQLQATVRANGFQSNVFLDGLNSANEAVEFIVQSQVGSGISISASLLVGFQWMEISRATVREEINASVNGPYLTETSGLNVQFIQN
jgi:hypothetical protein